MFSSNLVTFICLAVAGSSVMAGPTLYKRDTPSPALAAREPQFSVNIPNTIPVSGSFPNGISITPQTPSGSIVTSNRNGTFPFNLFGRDDVVPDHAGGVALGLLLSPGAPGDQVLAMRPAPVVRDATPALAAREPQFSVNIPNNIPVSGSFPNGISITPQTPSGSIVTSNRNGTFPFNLFGRDEATPVLAAREPQFSVNIPNNIPVSGSFPNGISITPQTPSGSIVTSNRNGTFPFNLFGRDGATPALAAREPQFSVNIPNNIPVSGSFPNGISITPQTPSGSIVTSDRNGTFPFNLFGRDE